MDRGSHNSIPWLVKANGRILGPFSIEELAGKLRSRELVLFDEVSQPISRWTYVRDEPIFAKIVEELRNSSYGGREDTMTSTLGTRSITKTEEITGSIPGIPDGNSRMPSGGLPEDTGDIPFEGSSTPLKTYGSRQDPNVAQKYLQKHMLWFALPVVIIIGLGLVSLIHSQNSGSRSNLNYDHLLQQGVDAKRIGDYTKALEYLKQAQMIRPDDAEINFVLAPMLIALEGQTVLGKRMLQKAIVLKFSPSEIAQAKTAIGLAEIIDGNFDMAKETFNEAVEIQKNYYPSMVNLGAIQLARGDYRSAEEQFSEALKESPQDSTVIILMNLSLLNDLEKRQKGPEAFAEIGNNLANFLRDNLDYRQEAALLAAYIKLLRHADSEVDSKIDEILDMDPRLTEDHLHDLLIYRKPASWEALLPFCKKLQGINPSARRQGLLAYCYFKTGNILESRRLIEAALRRAPQDPLLKSHYGLMLKDVGQESEARATLKNLPDTNSQLPYLAQARVCEKQNDWDCAEAAYEKLLKINSSSIQGLTGMARVFIERGDIGHAKELLNQGMSLSSTYIPLIQLQWVLNDKTGK